jgi:tryptophan-rich sensory protein
MNLFNSFSTNYNYTNYADYIKPTWAPPSWLFGPVWTFLYIIIAISFGYVFYLYFKKEIKFAVLLPFILNLIFNFLFTPIQFGLQNYVLGGLDVLLVFITLIWALKKIYKINKKVFYWNLIYLAWVSFATILDLTVIYLNLVK